MNNKLTKLTNKQLTEKEKEIWKQFIEIRTEQENRKLT